MKKTKGSPRWLLATGIVLVLMIILAACKPAVTEPAPTPTAAPTEPAAPAGLTEFTLPTPEPITLEGATTTDSGLQYLEQVAGSGSPPKAGDVIKMHYIVTLPDGTELANTYKDNLPITTLWGADRLLPGWEEGIGLMKVGGKSQIVIPPDLAFGAEGAGSIPPNSQIIIEMELLSSEAAPSPTSVKADQLTKTESGLEYYDITAGEGAEAAQNSNVSTQYVVWVKNDAGYDYIDQSEGDQAVNFVVGRGDTVFPGWEEGVTGMKVGGKRLLVIPPVLAFGEQGSGLIPPNAVLVMEITLTEVTEPRLPTKVDESDFTTTESGLKYYDLVEGDGASPESGQTIVVHYTGWLEDGTQFDSSVDRGEPFPFQIGMGNVIKGWDEGVLSMKVGGKRQLVIPADLAYGDQGAGGLIPPGATLVFEVELLEIR